jgi:putative protease
MAAAIETSGPERPSPPGVANVIALPELISPAGNWECVKAAIENGANAIYFGLERHNARLRADNFTETDLPRLMEFLHRRGARGYVCFNTLIFADELEESEQYLRALIAAGVDAVIIQDVGVGRLIRRLSPDVPIHASTQMTITSAAGVAFARDLGCNLVILARECFLRDIEQIQSSLAETGAALPSLPLEVFIHGALCVAYSGQCLTSEALGGRSANRGVCAQACRMPYELISDGQVAPLGDRRYLLSPQDLVGLELLPELVRLGVASLKIEGRLKTPEYVANITRIYREALDRLNARWAVSQEPGASLKPGGLRVDASPYRYDMEMAFSRGLYTGWFNGINNQELVHGRFGTKRGVFLGTVTRVLNEQAHLDLRGPLKPGDGVVFDAGRPDLEEQGGRVYDVLPLRRGNSGKGGQPASTLKGGLQTGEVALGFGQGDIDFSRVQVGDKVWKTSDPALEKRWRQSYAGEQPKFQRPVTMTVAGRAGESLRMGLSDGEGHRVELKSQMPLAAADKQPLTDQKLREQLGRLGGTPFRLAQLDNQLMGPVILPLSELNRLRREAVAALDQQRALPLRWTLDDTPAISGGYWANRNLFVKGETAAAAELIVLVRNQAQLAAALRCGVPTVYCEFDDPKQYREAVRTVRESGSCESVPRSVWVAPPRVFKPGEEWILQQVRSCDADGYLVRNYDHLQYFAKDRRIGDYSLNIANPLAAELFIEGYSLERVTASYDLNIAQLTALLRSAPPAWFEVTIHQHIPMFHMEHCVFCAFLSQGTDYTNCGRPCDKHEVKVRDRVGAEHPVRADAGCRNTVFSALAQTGAESVAQLLALGARKFRVEFVSETPEQVERTVAKYRQLLRGEITGAQLWQDLKLLNQIGVTRGQMMKVNQ